MSDTAQDIEGRIERLLDQLENPALTEREAEQIKGKIDYFRSMQ